MLGKASVKYEVRLKNYNSIPFTQMDIIFVFQINPHVI